MDLSEIENNGIEIIQSNDHLYVIRKLKGIARRLYCTRSEGFHVIHRNDTCFKLIATPLAVVLNEKMGGVLYCSQGYKYEYFKKDGRSGIPEPLLEECPIPINNVTKIEFKKGFRNGMVNSLGWLE